MALMTLLVGLAQLAVAIITILTRNRK